MGNPILIDVTRGPVVESSHTGAMAIVDHTGAIRVALGDVERPIYPRSAIKVLQALPLIQTGAADAFGYGDKALALACSSHNGAPEHVETAKAMLAAANVPVEALLCGKQTPRAIEDRRRLADAGTPATAIHNNCSGKHAGFLAVASHLGEALEGYTEPDHPVQQRICALLEDVMEAPHSLRARASDGCTVPTWAVPLRAAALGFAKLAAAFNGRSDCGLDPDRAEAARRLMTACFAEPYYVAGRGRFCTAAMTALGPQVFVKTGAEGVFCAAFPEQGLGLALKCDDGAKRGSEAMMASAITAILGAPSLEPEWETLAPFFAPPVFNRRDSIVGRIRAAPALRDGLAQAGFSAV